MKIMLVMTNCAKTYGSPIYQSLLENAGDATRHNSVTLFPQMHYPAQGKTGGKIFPLFASKNVHYLRFTYIYDPISNFNRGVSRRRVHLIIKKYPRELYNPIADHPGIYLIKRSQFYKAH